LLDDDEAALLRTMVGRTLVGGRSQFYLEELTDRFGPRLSGSDVHRDAAAWVRDRLQEAGVEARIERFTMAQGWRRGMVELDATLPSKKSLHAACVGWTAGTGDGERRAQIVAVEFADPSEGPPAPTSGVPTTDETKALAGAKGKAILLDRQALAHGTVGRKRMAALAASGAAFVLLRQSEWGHALVAHTCSVCEGLGAPLPMIQVSREDSAWLDRQRKKGPVQVSLRASCALTGPVDVPNVIGEIRGADAPDEWVLVGAHLDAWDPATGAQDNGSGVASVLEVARVLGGLDRRPPRSVRFALWGGEEQGLFGSKAYAALHRAELDRGVAVLNTDYGAGAPTGFSTGGRAEVVKALRPWVESRLAGLGGTVITADATCDTDHCPFMAEGVPTLNLTVDAPRYFDVHHRTGDTIDKIHPAALAQSAAYLLATVWHLASRKDRLAPRLPKVAVEKSLKAAGVLEDVVAEGLLGDRPNR
jgi:hypothetical protein